MYVEQRTRFYILSFFEASLGVFCVQIHQTYYDAVCEQLGATLIMPDENLSIDS